MEQVATHLKLHKLLVVGSSVGATYALALAAYLPDRVQATLLISPSGSTGALLLARHVNSAYKELSFNLPKRWPPS